MNIPGGLSSDLTSLEFALLTNTILTNGLKSYLEIGVWYGVNLYKMAKIFEENRHYCKIVGFDCFNNDPEDDNSHVSGWPDISIAQNLLSGFVNTAIYIL